MIGTGIYIDITHSVKRPDIWMQGYQLLLSLPLFTWKDFVKISNVREIELKASRTMFQRWLVLQYTELEKAADWQNKLV